MGAHTSSKGGNPPPTPSPTSLPTGPTVLPTLPRIPTKTPTKSPTVLPSFSVETVCPMYSTSNTINAQQNYISCSFVACPGTYVSLQASQLYPTKNLFVAVFDSYGNEVADLVGASSLGFSTSSFGVCQIYTLRQGCVGATACGSIITVEGGVATSLSPSMPLLLRVRRALPPRSLRRSPPLLNRPSYRQRLRP